MISQLALLALASFSISLLVTRWLTSTLRSAGLIDHPNERSSHRTPTPRGGGIGILAGLAVGWLGALVLGFPTPGPWIAAGCLMIAAVGWLDDVRDGVPPLARLGVHLLAAALVLWHAPALARLPLPHPLDIELGAASWLVGLLWIVGLTNLFNFLDGIDGFAAGQAALAAAGLLTLAGLIGNDALLVTSASLLGACLGFLPYNWSPARVFMGDVGSSTLGFLLAAIAFVPLETPLTRTTPESIIFATALLSWFFLADGTMTIGGRTIRGERFWQPHRQHLYQRWVRTGLSHGQVTLRILLLALVPAVLGVRASYLGTVPSQWLALGVAGLLFIALWIAVRLRERGQPL